MICITFYHNLTSRQKNRVKLNRENGTSTVGPKKMRSNPVFRFWLSNYENLYVSSGGFKAKGTVGKCSEELTPFEVEEKTAYWF